MRRIGIAFATLLTLFPISAGGAVIKITATSTPDPQFIPGTVQVAAGDTLRWMRGTGLGEQDHTVTSGDFGDPQAGSEYDAPITQATPMFQFQFNTPGSYSNFCIPHGDPDFDNMKGTVVVVPPVDEYVSTTTQLFTEDSVLIEPGQSVEFYNGDGEHTLTNGTGAMDPNAGNTFNSVLGTSIPAIQLTFNVAGVYPFFCVPHEDEGMFTTVYVVEPVTCECDCHGDPAPAGACDGVQTVLDVTSVINVAFRGAASIVDPNANCPRETTDSNCDGVTSVLDVTKMINVAFRGANAATEICNPCP